ncbi:MAG TPA: SelB C-terminal domain-containing protein, partial [Anaerolineales bacterium]|nr:SelB C-terminal domain-containing protein [Anaerolineales bacterium]
GSRVAVNVSGVDASQVRRGDVLSAPGAYEATRRLDVLVRVLPEAPVAVHHGQAVKAHLGTADVVARVRLLEADELAPGTKGWAQLLLDRDVIAADQDRFILRRPTPAATLGGGVIVAAHPRRSHRRRDPSVVATLEGLSHGGPEERVLARLAEAGISRLADLEGPGEMPTAEIRETLAELVRDGRVIRLATSSDPDEACFAAADAWRVLTDRAVALLTQYHADHRLRPGMPREEFRHRMGLPARYFDEVLAGLGGAGVVSEVGTRLARTGFAPHLDAQEEAHAEELRQRFAAAPMGPPSIHECRQVVGDEGWNLLVWSGEFVEVSDDVVFDASTYRRVVDEIRLALGQGESITVAQVRDRYQTSRKYALALLEHLDAAGVTMRVGDERRLRR